MSLLLYSEPNKDATITSSKPFTVTFDGRVGGIQDKCIYLRNDSDGRYYSDVVVSIIGTAGNNITDGSQDGFEWKMIQKDIVPTNEEWGEVAAGNSVSLSSAIGSSSKADIVTYVPIWVRVAIPRSQRVQKITSVVFRVSATEIVVSG